MIGIAVLRLGGRADRRILFEESDRPFLGVDPVFIISNARTIRRGHGLLVERGVGSDIKDVRRRPQGIRGRDPVGGIGPILIDAGARIKQDLGFAVIGIDPVGREARDQAIEKIGMPRSLGELINVPIRRSRVMGNARIGIR